MYDAIGFALAAIVATVGVWRASRKAPATFYAREVYGLGPRGELRFAAAGAVMCLAFAVDLSLHARFAVGLVAVCAVLSLLYAASFVRGAQGEDE